NIFFTDKKTTKLGNFGVAKVLCRRDMAARMETGMPPYVSPEVWEGKPFTKKSDIWALGCLLYELCTLQTLRGEKNLDI
ncbi:serine/threonine-protein kinase Nek1-like, partial [Arapaima gigas]